MKFNKAQIGIQSLFYIMMIILMVVIIVFGISKLVEVDDVLSNQDKAEIISDLQDALLYCEDPLNRGNTRIFEVENQLFDSVCVLDSDILDTTNPHPAASIDGVREIYEAGDNVVLLNSEFLEGNILIGGNVVDSFPIDIILNTPGTICWFDLEGDDKLEFEITC